MSELSKYFTSETVEVWRSEIQLANYNPRKISPEARKKLKANIKENGIIGGLVWNVNTSNLVSGHQRLSVLDELNKYDGEVRETDYKVKVERIEVDEKKEKELNIFFNNTQVQGDFDYDLLALMIPDIDYKSAGLSEEDLQLIGVDYLLQTDAEKDIANSFDELLAPGNALNEAQKEARKEEKKQLSEAEKIAHNKEVKAKVQADAQEKAENLDAYVTLSFDTFKAKAAFMKRFGFHEQEKFVKGELFSDMIERVD